MTVHIVLAGGGTAGHVEPALATAEALRRDYPAWGVTVLGTTSGLEARLVPQRGFPLEFIPRAPFPRQLNTAALRWPGTFVDSIRAAGAVFDSTQAEVVVGFGGYVSAPAYLAARKRGIPIVVHEANAKPGWANRLGARIATTVATADPTVALPNAIPVGIPLRTSIAGLDRAAVRSEARAALGLDPVAPVLLAFGGSSGARRINTAVAEAMPELAAAGIEVLHALGQGNPPLATDPRYHPVEYLDRMELAYAAADLVLSRSGALSCAELAAVGLPAAYVPLPIGNGEQRLNAEPVVAAGGGLLVADADCSSAWIQSTLVPLLGDRERLSAMASRAAAYGQRHRGADERLAQLIAEVVGARPHDSKEPE